MCPEGVVPEGTSYAKIPGHLSMVVESVVHLGSIQQLASSQMPPMDGVMNNQIPEISKHQSYRCSACHFPPDQNERGREPAQRKAQQAHPGRSSHIRAWSRMVLFVKTGDWFDQMQNKAMHSILGDRPRQ